MPHERNSMFKSLLVAVAGIAMLATTGTVARAESQLDFTLVNATGYGIKAIYIAPSASKNWEENVIDEVLETGESIAIEFSPKTKATKFDLMVSWEDEDDPDVYWTGYDLSEISKITLKYDRKTNKTTAATE